MTITTTETQRMTQRTLSAKIAYKARALVRHVMVYSTFFLIISPRKIWFEAGKTTRSETVFDLLQKFPMFVNDIANKCVVKLDHGDVIRIHCFEGNIHVSEIVLSVTDFLDYLEGL